MSAATLPSLKTFADVLSRLGDVPPERVRLHPAPGTATVADVLRTKDVENRSCELVDGTLVEKAMGVREALLAVALGAILREFVKQHHLGFVTGPDGTLRLLTDLVRIPDVAFISWEATPEDKAPEEPVPPLVPDLAVEIISRGNTAAELQRKREEYFAAGVRLVWVIDPRSRTARVFTSADSARELSADDSVDGGDVLPGFSLKLADLFAELDESAPG